MKPEDLLGRELNETKAALEAEGVQIRAVKVSSRKGVAGNSERVIRVRKLDANSVEICYAVFKTDVRYTAACENKGG